MLPSTLTSTTPHPAAGQPYGPGTYGDFMTRVTAGVQTAQHAAAEPFADAATAHAELLGYERFLHVAGVHLQLLAGLARTPSRPLRKLATALEHLEPSYVPEGRWYDAATLLGTAHDLLATHVEDGLLPRTPQAEELLTARGAGRASRDVTELVLTALSARQQLLRSALLSQRRLPPSQRPISKAHGNHLAKTAQTIEVYCMAALWSQHQEDPVRGRGLLSDLAPAIPVAAAPRTATFSGCLHALQVLRQLVHNQARGTTPTSPASLRDLAVLGARFTDSTDALPQPHTPLERVQHAHAVDGLETAHAAWLTASRDLTTVVQGITKAPGAYGAAIHTLLQADLDDSTLRPAVLAALPRMGRQASHTITELARTGSLLTPQSDLNLHRSWRPLPANAVAELAGRFQAAGHATARAAQTAQQLARQQASQAPEVPPAPVSTQARRQRLAVHR